MKLLLIFIVARDVRKRQLKTILNCVYCEYDTLLIYNTVHRLSLAISLERLVNCLDEIRLILHKYNKTNLKELDDTEWLTKCMFFTDIIIAFKYFE